MLSFFVFSRKSSLLCGMKRDKRLVCTSADGNVKVAASLREAAAIIGCTAPALSQSMKKRYGGVARCKGWTIRTARPLVVVVNELARKMWLCTVDGSGRYMKADGTGELQILKDMRIKEVTEALWTK